MLSSTCGSKRRWTFEKVEIDVGSNKLLIVKGGNVTVVNPPMSGFGEQVAVWINGKVDRVDVK